MAGLIIERKSDLEDIRAKIIFDHFNLDKDALLDAYMSGLHYSDNREELILPIDENPLNVTYKMAGMNADEEAELHGKIVVGGKFINHLAAAAAVNYELTVKDRILLSTGLNNKGYQDFFAIQREDKDQPLKIARGCILSIDKLVKEINHPSIIKEQETLKTMLGLYDSYFKK